MRIGMRQNRVQRDKRRKTETASRDDWRMKLRFVRQLCNYEKLLLRQVSDFLAVFCLNFCLSSLLLFLSLLSVSVSVSLFLSLLILPFLFLKTKLVLLPVPSLPKFRLGALLLPDEKEEGKRGVGCSGLSVSLGSLPGLLLLRDLLVG